MAKENDFSLPYPMQEHPKAEVAFRCKNKIKINSHKDYLLMQQLQLSHNQAHLQQTPRKLSDSPLTDHSDPESPSPIISAFDLPLCFDLRLHLYEANADGPTISDRMNRRGMSWLQTVSWSRGFSQACIWNATLLFYAYKSHFPFRKEEMEGIILVCLQLSSKIHECRRFQTRDLLMLSSRPISRDSIRCYQQRILEMVDFNLIIPHYFTSLYQTLEGEINSKAIFLCELLAFKNHLIFFQKAKIERVIRLATGCSCEDILEQEVEEIRELLSEKESRILHHKYGSQFDVDSFVQLFNTS